METTVDVELVPVAHATKQVLSVKLTTHWDSTGYKSLSVHHCTFEADASKEDLAAALRILANSIDPQAGGN